MRAALAHSHTHDVCRLPPPRSPSQIRARRISSQLHLEVQPDQMSSASGGAIGEEALTGVPFAKGTDGEIHLVRFEGEFVAAKVIDISRVSAVQTPKKLEAFRKEAAAMAQLHSSKIIQVHGVITSIPGKLVMLMEFADRGSLRDVLSGEELPSPAERAKFAADVAFGMAALHAGGIVHRDLKSLNVLVHGHVAKICDFGRVRADDLTTQATVGDGFVGTYAWAAPETLEDSIYNEASDMYAFGIIMWELLECDVPWQGKNDFQIGKKVMSGERPPLPSEIDPILQPLLELIPRCWHADATARPRFAEVASALSNGVALDIRESAPAVVWSTDAVTTSVSLVASTTSAETMFVDEELDAQLNNLMLAPDVFMEIRSTAVTFMKSVGADSLCELLEEGYGNELIEKLDIPAIKKKKLRSALGVKDTRKQSSATVAPTLQCDPVKVQPGMSSETLTETEDIIPVDELVGLWQGCCIPFCCSRYVQWRLCRVVLCTHRARSSPLALLASVQRRLGAWRCCAHRARPSPLAASERTYAAVVATSLAQVRDQQDRQQQQKVPREGLLLSLLGHPVLFSVRTYPHTHRQHERLLRNGRPQQRFGFH